mmetsp:Transcript_17916/g.51353  ORF Transcript_17916/g.51353 Transcript_17916/m.51353 type:complete len:115 (+) Transcript_17916:1237-1581(+)
MGGIPATSGADNGANGLGEGDKVLAAAEESEEAGEGLSRFLFSSLGDVVVGLHILGDVAQGRKVAGGEIGGGRKDAVEEESSTMRSRSKPVSAMEWFVAVGSSLFSIIRYQGTK